MASLVAGLVLIEFTCRAIAWGYLFAYPNFVLTARTTLAEGDRGRYRHDPQLGHVPRAGYSGGGTTIEDGGLRRTGPVGAGTALAGPPILAVGDSYTFGDEVDDGQTWPAQLQALTGRRVLNGGVSGYGFDQSVLRAEQLAPKVGPAAIVVGFIADDIRRTEMRRLWSADKPYFVLEDGALVPRGVPVPERAAPASTLSTAQWILGYSYALDLLLRPLNLLHDWYGDHQRALPAGSGPTIACRLADRLAALQKSSGAPVVVLAAYDPVVWDDPAFAAEQRKLTGGLLACADKAGLQTIDSFDALAATGSPRKLYVTWHMNEAGNRLVAELVARKLATLGIR
ncbi:MAG: GDSL-type esterase/lipase family protein [Proteobacteria bacterium]|nr:GDSL-type esterase/lipase family protein [Pseudomonadota bacterium]